MTRILCSKYCIKIIQMYWTKAIFMPFKKKNKDAIFFYFDGLNNLSLL